MSFQGVVSMSLQKNREGRRSQRSFRPRFESLESRRVLSASPLFNFHGPATTPAPAASVNVSGNTVSVKDSNAGDTITVTDSGAGAVSVTITNGTTTVATGSGTGITRVNINATGGGDTVNYTYGTTLTVTAAGNIAADSLLNAFISGGPSGWWGSRTGGGDTISFTYSGQLLGNLGVATSGAGGNETIAQNITLAAGSTGNLYSVAFAGKSTTANNITLNVNDASPSTLTSLN